MTGQFSKLSLGMLAAFLATEALPVMAQDSAKGSAGDCPIVAGLNRLQPAPENRFSFSPAGAAGAGTADCAAFLAPPKSGESPLGPRAGVEAWQRADWSAASGAGGEDQGVSHDTSTSGGRLARMLRHVTWSWAPAPPLSGIFQTGVIATRP